MPHRSALLLLCGCLELPQLPAHPAPDASTHAGSLDAAAPSQALRIGTWNVRRLGLDETTDIARVAAILETHFDLVALTEVMNTGGFQHTGYDALLEALGGAWSGQITTSPRPNLDAPFAEYYAVLRRTERVRPCEGATELAYYPDGDGRDGAISAFLREPAFGCYVASLDGVRGADFVLGVFHARWGRGDAEEIALEVAGLREVLSVAAGRFQEPDVLLLGDFNLHGPALAQALGLPISTLGQGSTLGPQGHISGNLYDHLVVLDAQATRELEGDAEVLDVRDEAGGPETFLRGVSDHLPIRAVLDVSQPDDD